eukprot:9025204-Pyramimonas_sp.AAC.1
MLSSQSEICTRARYVARRTTRTTRSDLESEGPRQSSVVTSSSHAASPSRFLASSPSLLTTNSPA